MRVEVSFAADGDLAELTLEEKRPAVLERSVKWTGFSVRCDEPLIQAKILKLGSQILIFARLDSSSLK